VLFNSLTFIVFFAVVVSAYWTMRSWPARKNLLVVASYIFYGAWNPPFAALLFGTTAMDFYLGRIMGKQTQPEARKVWLVISVAVNLSMLGFFKYGNFLLENFQWVLSRGGIAYRPPHLALLHPRHLSRRFKTDPLAPRLRSRGFLLSAARRRADRARGRFPSATRCAAQTAARPFLLGSFADDVRAL